jgi:peptidoglycan hydrolase-like protein with peptidoglycan-binding domain
MRIVGAALLMFALSPDIGNATPKAKPDAAKAAPAQPKPPPPGSPRSVYAAMPESEWSAIQTDLIWTGDYNGIVGTEFGDNSITAVKSFQRRNGEKETGILNPDERAKLAESARTKRERAGWRVVEDRVTGARLGIPLKLAPQSSPSTRGTRWQSSHGEVQVETFRVAAAGTTLPSVIEQMKKDAPSRKVEYQVVKPDFFVMSGLQGGVKKFYVRAQIKDSDVRGVIILYDVAMEGTLDPIVVAMSNAFAGFPPAPVADAAGSAPRRPVEYATGIVVSEAGHIITDRHVVDDCQFVVIPGLGHAQHVADDKTAELALLRVFGVKDLVPAAPADAAGSASEVALIGVADPQAQSGGDAVSTSKARVLAASGSSRPIEPTPSPGFSGSAAIDGEARLLGMVDMRLSPGASGAQAAIVPAETIRTFLAAQNIAPANGAVGIESIKASVVRVICVRK